MNNACNAQDSGLDMVFHHIGLLTGQPETAGHNLAGIGYKIGEMVFDPLQNVDICMAESAGFSPSIEIIHPRKDNTGLNRLLTRKGDFAYHLCYSTRNLIALLEALTAKNVRLHELSPPKPAVLFASRPVAFYAVDGVGVMEFLELP